MSELEVDEDQELTIEHQESIEIYMNRGGCISIKQGDQNVSLELNDAEVFCKLILKCKSNWLEELSKFKKEASNG